MSRAALPLALSALLAPALTAGCADTARRLYLEEAVDDLAGAPRDDDDVELAADQLSALATNAAISSELTLTECMRLALVHYEYLAARGEDILQADTLRAEAITSMLPRVGFQLRHTRNSNPVSFQSAGSSVDLAPGSAQPFLPREFTEHSFVVTQPLFNPRTLPSYWLASATRRVEALNLDDLRDEVLFRVATAFYEVLGFDRDVQALRSTMAQVDEQLRVLDARLAVGEAQRQEVLLAEARRAEVEVELVQAELDREQARARLSRLTGVPGRQRLLDTMDAVTPPGDVTELINRAYRERPDLNAARMAIEQAEQERNLVIADYLPQVNLDFTYYTRAVAGFNQFLDYAATANLLWTIFDGGARETRLVRARSVERQRELLARALAEDIRLEVVEAALAYSALDRAQRALAARRVAATGAQELASLQYTAGEATNLDVLVAVAERQNSERNEIRGEFARKLAALRIWLATGEITRSPPARRLLEARR